MNINEVSRNTLEDPGMTDSATERRENERRRLITERENVQVERI